MLAHLAFVFYGGPTSTPGTQTSVLTVIAAEATLDPMVSFEAAREFVLREARVLEQRLFATLFEDAPPAGVARALGAYRNDDGGLGHCLEPDARCPESQPLFVAFGLQTLAEAGGRDDELVGGCCDYLASVAYPRGAVPIVLPSVERYPRAAHWADGRRDPGLHPAVGIAASLHELGFEHEWLDRATDYCLDELSRQPPSDAHVLRDTLRFLDVVEDAALRKRTAQAIPQAAWFRRDPHSTEYGLTPLQLAPTPARARMLFSESELAAHLDALAAAQCEDGGWPISWDPPGAAARLEWRGRWTVEALATLRAYGRIAG